MDASRFRSLATWVFLVGIAVVYILYQRVLSPEPLALVLLATGWLAGFSLAAYGAGCALGGKLPGGDRLEVLLLRLAAGAGLLTFGALALGLLGMLRKWALVLTLLAFAVFGGVQLGKLVRGERPGRLVPSLPWFFLVPAAAISFLAACVPSGFYDQLNYHLALPFHWLRLGKITVFPRHAYSFLPANMSVLYTYALAVLPPWSAQLLHWWMGALAAAFVAALATRVGSASSWGPVVFAAAPTVVLTATWAAADLGVACFAGAAWLALLLALERHGARQALVVAGAFAGLAAGIKLLAIATVVGPLGLGALTSPFLVPGSERRWRTGLARGLWVGTGTLLALGPWLLRSWLLTGNPLYPAFSDSPVGGGVSVSALLGKASSWPGMLHLAREKLSSFLMGTFAPEGAAGLVGPMFLALLPLAALSVVARRCAAGTLLLVGVVAGVAGWSLLPQLPRYLVGVLVPAAALVGAGLAQLLSWWPKRVTRVLEAVVAFGVLWGTLGGLSAEVIMRVGVALGQLDPARWMTQAVPYWTAAQYINGELPPSARILMVAEARTLYLERDVVVDDPFRTPLICELADSAPSPEALAGALARMGVTHLLINWQEAQRMAALNRRETYLAPASVRGRANLEAFFSGWVDLLFRDGPVEVYALRTHPGGGAR